MIRVFLVDDHGLMRTGYRMMLESQLDMQLVGEAGTGDEALPAIRTIRPDVVVSDLHLPGMSGLELAERLLRVDDAPKLIIVSMQRDGPMPRRLLDLGVSGYLTKDCEGQEVLRAIRDSMRGKRYVSADIAQQIALARIEGGGSPFDALSSRELEIAVRLAHGQRPADIAVELSLSPKTVSTHKARLFEKLGISDTVALARLARQYGLIEPE